MDGHTFKPSYNFDRKKQINIVDFNYYHIAFLDKIF